MKLKQILLSNLTTEVVAAPSVPLKERKLGGPVRRIHACKAGWLFRPSPEGVRGVETTAEQLSQMVENFYSQPEASTKPVYIGHPDAEGIEAEAYGWIIGAESEGLDLFLYVEPSQELESWIQSAKFGYCSIFYKVNGFDRHTSEDWGAELLSLGITNQPAKDELSSLQKSEVYFFSNLEGDEGSYLESNPEIEQMAMNDEDIKKVAEALSAHVTAIKLGAIEGELSKAVCSLLGLPENASPEDLLGAVQAALEAKAAKEAEEATKEPTEPALAEGEKTEEDKAKADAEAAAKAEADKKKEDESLSALEAATKKIAELETVIKSRTVEDVIRSAGIDDAEEIAPLMEVGLSNLETLSKILKTRKPANAASVSDTLTNASKGKARVTPSNAFEAEAFSVLEGMKKKN